MAGANTLAYYDKATVMALKCFIVHDPGKNLLFIGGKRIFYHSLSLSLSLLHRASGLV
jgi:hypothetical protein